MSPDLRETTMTIADEAPGAPAASGGATRTAIRTCPLCEAGCGLEITLRPTADGGEEVVRILEDQDDVFSHGYICPKGSTLKQLHEDPDRLRTPADQARRRLRRGDLGRSLRRDRGPTPAHPRARRSRFVCGLHRQPERHSLGALLYNRAVIKAPGSHNLFSASTVDQLADEQLFDAISGNPVLKGIPAQVARAEG
jgi:hypothetical protein